MAMDPVCDMQVDENKAAGKSEYGGGPTISARSGARRSSISIHGNTPSRRVGLAL